MELKERSCFGIGDLDLDLLFITFVGLSMFKVLSFKEFPLLEPCSGFLEICRGELVF